MADPMPVNPEHALRAAVHRLMSAADHLDVEDFVAMFHPDADFHNPIGMVLRGREEIRALHEKLYSPDPPPGFPTFAHATSTGQIQALRLLRPDVALVDWAWTQRGGTVEGQEWPDRQGLNTLVWIRTGGDEWRVIAWRDKDFPAEYERPPGY